MSACFDSSMSTSRGLTVAVSARTYEMNEDLERLKWHLGVSAARESEQSRCTLGTDQLRDPQDVCLVTTMQCCVGRFIEPTTAQVRSKATLDTGC